MLVDEAEITIKAGHGGKGMVSFRRPPERGPDGGNGGKGGSVYIRVINDITALAPFASKKYYEAQDGQAGSRNRRTGADAEDLELLIPLGTTIIDAHADKILELEQAGKRILICKGGLGGKGNWEFRSSCNTTPRYAQPGLNGEEKKLKLILKLLADFGLIGIPNAGKSSLLNELTKANVKVANYPFTTLEPNLGAFKRKIIADIPGLIEGAHKGKGLGIKFLKHIEKVTLLLHCISVESENIIKDYQIVRNELEKYNPELTKKEEVVLLTKTDLIDQTQLKQKLNQLKKLKKKVLPISIHDWDSLEKFKKLLI